MSFRGMMIAVLVLPAGALVAGTGAARAQAPASAPTVVSVAPDGAALTTSPRPAEDPEDRLIRAPAGRGASSDRGAAANRLSGAGGLLAKTLIILAIVLAAMWLVLQLLRRVGLRGVFGGSTAAVQVLHRGYVSNKHQLVVVRFGSRVLLLGVGPERIEALSELTEPAEAARIVAQVEGARPGSPSQDFRRAVEAAALDYEEPVPGSPLTAGAPEAQIGSLRKELRGLLARMQSLGPASPRDGA